MTNKVRVAHIVIKPVLVIDDGEELSPGPEVAELAVPLSKVSEAIGNLLDKLPEIESEIN